MVTLLVYATGGVDSSLNFFYPLVIIVACILLPRTFTVAGYPPIMPDFAGQLGEDDLIKLIAYIKSLSPNTPASQQGSQQPPIVIAPRAATRTGTAPR